MALPTSGVQQVKVEQPNPNHFVRNSGSYKITDIAGKVNTNQLEGRKIAVISGAGIAGLAAAFKLNAKEYDVTVVDKRGDFSRSNTINLNMEVQGFLREFKLLKEFEESIAARIQHHEIVILKKDDPHSILKEDTSTLQFEGSLKEKKIKKLFTESGIYSVQIKDLQAFLAQKAAHLGVKILGDSKIKITNQTLEKQVSEIEIQKTDTPAITLKPDLLFIAEGAHSETAKALSMLDTIVDNACSGENWIFGNFRYSGDKTFVTSMVETSQKTLQIANVIFNANSKIVNVAVTSDNNPTPNEISDLLKETAKKAFSHNKIEEALVLLESVEKPVHITNQLASICSKGNVFRIGDAMGHSSPLAGVGGTLGLTLVPETIEKLLEGIESNPATLHEEFKTNSQAYVNRWIDKSQDIKGKIQGIFNSELKNAEADDAT